MAAPTISGLEKAPTSHQRLLSWVREVADLTLPDRIVWCDGSDEEWQRMTEQLVAAGTFVPLRQKVNSFWCASDPDDVARVEERTFICSVDEADAGPTNNWMHPVEMKAAMTELYRGCMRGRTMYVVPFCMGPLEAEQPMLGVEITDSEYVVVSMRIMTRMGSAALARFGEDADFVPCLHSVGAPLEPGADDVPWPCNETKYICQFPEERLISPEDKAYYLAAAFPSGCGKTNLAMLEPTIPGWRVETLGDDIAWLRFGNDGRLYAVNPEYGLFGVAPGTDWKTNPNAMRTLAIGNSIFTNVARTDDNDIWWEGMGEPPSHLTDWKGRDWTPDSGELSSHPNSRFCTPITQCPILADEYEDPRGVPISAILFGGRRKTTIPLVTEARDWVHGVYMGA